MNTEATNVGRLIAGAYNCAQPAVEVNIKLSFKVSTHISCPAGSTKFYRSFASSTLHGPCAPTLNCICAHSLHSVRWPCPQWVLPPSQDTSSPLSLKQQVRSSDHTACCWCSSPRDRFWNKGIRYQANHPTRGLGQII
jgi:hypothetical protein